MPWCSGSVDYLISIYMQVAMLREVVIDIAMFLANKNMLGNIHRNPYFDKSVAWAHLYWPH